MAFQGNCAKESETDGPAAWLTGLIFSLASGGGGTSRPSGPQMGRTKSATKPSFDLTAGLHAYLLSCRQAFMSECLPPGASVLFACVLKYCFLVSSFSDSTVLKVQDLHLAIPFSVSGRPSTVVPQHFQSVFQNIISQHGVSPLVLLRCSDSRKQPFARIRYADCVPYIHSEQHANWQTVCSCCIGTAPELRP